MNHKSLVILALTAVFSISGVPISADDGSPGSAGEKFASIAKAVIGEVVPGVGAIVDLILPKIQKGKEVKKQEVVTVAELNQKIKEQKEKAEAQRQQLAQELSDYKVAQQKLVEGLQDVADEVAVVLDFLEPALRAQRRVIPILKSIADTPQPTVEQWDKYSKDWQKAYADIVALGLIPDDDVDLLTSQFLRDRLSKIRGLKSPLGEDVAEALSRHDRALSLVKLEKVDDRLSGVNAASGHLMDDLRAGFEDVADVGAGAAAPGGVGGYAYRKFFITYLDRATID